MDTKKLRQKILDLAIRGKLVPQDPNDEPASVLIEKIRLEKEQLIKEKKIKRDKNESYIYRSDKSYYEQLPFEIPNNWTWCKLGEICGVVRGGSPRPAGSNIYYNGDIPFLKVADLTKSKNMYVNTYQYTIKEAGLVKTRFIKKGTLLLTNSGATLGVPKICGIDATINDGIAAFLDLDDNQIEYLYWFLESQTQNMRNIDQGAAQPNLNTDIIKDFLIPIPPLTEQKRIASEIKHLFSVIDSLEENKISLEQFITQTKSKILDLAIRGKLIPQDPNDEPASVLLERIKSERSDSKKKTKNTGDNSHYQNLEWSVPSNWCWCLLSDVCTFERGITFPSTAKTTLKEEHLLPCIRTANVQEELELEDLWYIDPVYIKNNTEKLVRNGDIIMSSANSRELVGKTSFVHNVDYNMTFGGFVLNIRARGIEPKYLFYLLRCYFNNGIFMTESTQTTNIANINATVLGNLKMPLPPIHEQKKIVQTIEKLFRQLESIVVEL